MPLRLVYIVSHPIQYQAPLLRRVAAEEGVDFEVIFKDLGSTGRHFDPGFQTTIEWQVPLTEGYRYRLVPSNAQLGDAIGDCDALWLHGWQGPRMWRALELARRRGIPVLMRGENTMKAMPDGGGARGILKRRYLDAIFDRCTLFLYVGQANREYYLGHGIDPERLVPMPYAVDNDFFRVRAETAAPHRDRYRAALGLEPGRPIILYAGKLQGRKNPLLLIEAYRRLDRTALGQPYLLFAGDGELRQPVEHAAAADPAIRFLGFHGQEQLPALYDLADVFVLPSFGEPWGLAINEAMNAGCAVVVSDECGCAPNLVDESCGAVVPAGQVAPLTAALADILADRDRCRAMGAAALKRIGDWGLDAALEGLRIALARLRSG